MLELRSGLCLAALFVSRFCPHCIIWSAHVYYFFFFLFSFLIPWLRVPENEEQGDEEGCYQIVVTGQQ